MLNKALTIIPYVGFEGLEFGSARDIVRRRYPSANSFGTWKSSTHNVDSYEDMGLHFHYDQSNRLEFIECFRPCNPIYAGIELLNVSLYGALTGMKNAGHPFEHDDEAYTFNDVGISLYVPGPIIEAVSLYSRGYYDNKIDYSVV